MRTAVQCNQALDSRKIAECGFKYCEVPMQISDEGKVIFDAGDNFVSGIIFKMVNLSKENFLQALKYANNFNAEYICLDTRGIPSTELFLNVIKETIKEVKNTDIHILLENSFCLNQGVYQHNEFSDVNHLVRLIQKLNQQVEKDCFGICFNVGYANLLQCNIKEYVTQMLPYLKVLHVNDNDCQTNQKQMPYTFTYGRGVKTTEWNVIIGRLFQGQYQGWVVFDNTGTFERTPRELHSGILELMKAVCDEWEFYETFEEKINDAGKQIILFGAGKMARNYMERWGKLYPPAFLVDNNKNDWGELAFGVVIYSPEDILTIEPDKRTVLICNMHYREIGAQLERMGIEYQCYNDEYFM